MERYEEAVMLLKVVKQKLRGYSDEIHYRYMVDLLIIECLEKVES